MDFNVDTLYFIFKVLKLCKLKIINKLLLKMVKQIRGFIIFNNLFI